MNYREKIDYSSLSTFMSCPRKFLFQYIMHLRPAGKNINLAFGSCWHYGLEEVYHVLKKDVNIKTIDATILSVKSFNNLWKIEGEPYWPDEDIIFPKNPGHAANMYKEYWERHLKADTEKYNVLAVEAPFVISLDTLVNETSLPNYIGRLDLVLTKKDSEGIEIIDHKSTKALYKISTISYETSFQTDGYLTAGRIFYDVIPVITYRLALCQKSKIDFHPITINKRVSAIEHFLSNLVYYIKNIITNLDLLEEDLIECTDRKDILKSFPRCPGTACTEYMSQCPYYDICRMRNNPLQWKDRAPQGYKIDEWDPDLVAEKTAKRLSEIK